MDKKFYILYSKINARISDAVVPGYHIKFNDETYERISRRPQGKRVFKRLLNTTNNERLVLYI
jgi:hypothetical protein